MDVGLPTTAWGSHKFAWIVDSTLQGWACAGGSEEHLEIESEELPTPLSLFFLPPSTLLRRKAEDPAGVSPRDAQTGSSFALFSTLFLRGSGDKVDGVKLINNLDVMLPD